MRRPHCPDLVETEAQGPGNGGKKEAERHGPDGSTGPEKNEEDSGPDPGPNPDRPRGKATGGHTLALLRRTARGHSLRRRPLSCRFPLGGSHGLKLLAIGPDCPEPKLGLGSLASRTNGTWGATHHFDTDRLTPFCGASAGLGQVFRPIRPLNAQIRPRTQRTRYAKSSTRRCRNAGPVRA